LPSLAVTIGTLALFRGIAVGLLGTTAITEFPEYWTDLAKDNIPGTPIPVIMIPFVVLAVGFAVLLHFTPFGRSLYAIGLNKEAAAFSGIDVGRTKFLLFVMSGTVAGFAGVYFTLLYSNARGDNATGMELAIIAAVLLGGVSIFGGRGALHGVIAGVGALAGGACDGAAGDRWRHPAARHRCKDAPPRHGHARDEGPPETHPALRERSDGLYAAPRRRQARVSRL
jgi:ribose/xylose/arabinose/galactoside ABC-type transport system permease subunit